MKRDYTYQVGAEIKTVTLEPDGSRWRVTLDDKIYDVAAEQLSQGQLTLDVAGQPQQLHVARDGLRRYVALGGDTWRLERPQTASRRKRSGAGTDSTSGRLEATMPGLILALQVAVGDEVERGQTLLLMEAMKMELRISAPFAGQVSHIHCNVGQVVEREQILIEINPAHE